MFTDSFDEFDEPKKKKVEYVQLKIEFPEEPAEEPVPAPNDEKPKQSRGRGKGTGRKSKKTDK